MRACWPIPGCATRTVNCCAKTVKIAVFSARLEVFWKVIHPTKRNSAPEIEEIVDSAVKQKINGKTLGNGNPIDTISRVVLGKERIQITCLLNDSKETTIKIPRDSSKRHDTKVFYTGNDREPDQKLLQALVRAQAWLSELAHNRSSYIEELASKTDIHPKVIREAFKMAFLAPDIVTSIFAGEAAFELADLRNVSALSWQNQREEPHHR